MLRQKPRVAYCGLTIIMSNPSRFDTMRLLTANGGAMFNDYCLRPEFNLLQSDIRLMEDSSPLLPNTKCILLLGQSAAWKYLPETNGQFLGAIRGAVYEYKSIPTICSFNPQDAVDYKNYEDTLNPMSKDYTGNDSLSDSDEEDEGDVKSFGATKRANYAFWLRRDVWKCKQILTGRNGTDSKKYPLYHIYPSSEEVINILTNTKNEILILSRHRD